MMEKERDAWKRHLNQKKREHKRYFIEAAPIYTSMTIEHEKWHPGQPNK